MDTKQDIYTYIYIYQRLIQYDVTYFYYYDYDYDYYYLCAHHEVLRSTNAGDPVDRHVGREEAWLSSGTYTVPCAYVTYILCGWINAVVSERV